MVILSRNVPDTRLLSQGKTRAAALQNIQEAIELCLENRASEGWELPENYEILQLSIGV